MSGLSGAISEIPTGQRRLPITTTACSTANPFDEATFQPLECKAGFRPAFDDEIEGTVRMLCFFWPNCGCRGQLGQTHRAVGWVHMAAPVPPALALVPCTRRCRCGLKASAAC